MFNFLGGRRKVEEPVVGPQADERDLSGRLETIMLAGGAPLYLAFLDEVPRVAGDEVQEAKQRVASLIEHYPDAIRSCAGKTMDEARKILEQAERGLIARAA